MAEVEYYIGTVGPLFMDDTDPLFSDPGQMALKQDVADGITEAGDTVESETTFGQAADAGVSDDFSRSDHTHGTPANPVSGVTADKTVGSETWHFTNGLLTSIT